MKHILSHKLFENEEEIPYSLQTIHDAMEVPQRERGISIDLMKKNIYEVDVMVEELFDEGENPVSLQKSLQTVVTHAKQYIDPQYLVFYPENYILSSYVKHYLFKNSNKKVLFDNHYDMGTRTYSVTNYHSGKFERVQKTEKLTAEDHLTLYENSVMNFLRWDVVDLFNYEDDYTPIDMQEDDHLAPFDLQFYVTDYRLINACLFAANLSNYSSRARDFLNNSLKQHTPEEMTRITMLLANFTKNPYHLHRINKLQSTYNALKQLDFLKDGALDVDDFDTIKHFLGV